MLFSKIHELAGMANSSRHPNAVFVMIGYDTILEATVDLKEGAELFAKYELKIVQKVCWNSVMHFSIRQSIDIYQKWIYCRNFCSLKFRSLFVDLVIFPRVSSNCPSGLSSHQFKRPESRVWPSHEDGSES